ncbi:MAG TPA: D-arabinono-1,4-lactone oxidase [Niabella sp.]|nr:D-arabinono-1,4-lactone oxidase [Niabella sp.]HOZ95418.1 D-arabinono-1,4-lactone oxidase [Niabella sp.]HQW14307.1 D-arabinono-1,4-lactone oxidase [Niabella sp.]HQX18413.1 D-arabinono-1,4-lactone oxidase [Niabella sp.]HQX40095.1 D-arabinono-1,4-lactone oxidase [Niabella sp.]
MKKAVQNFGRTWKFTPKQIACPSSVEELIQVVKANTSLRPVGSAHSWSKGIVTDEVLVSLEKLNQIHSIDLVNLQVRVGAGIVLKDLMQILESKELAISNLGSVNAQTLAGAICTGTHGTGKRFQCLAAQVESFEMVDGSGLSHLFTKNDETFYALLTGMGCGGIIHTITLNVVKAFQMHAITDVALFDEVVENLEQYTESYDHFKFWWMAPGQKVIVFKNSRTDAKRNDKDWVRFVKDEVISVVIYRFLVAIGKLNRKSLIPGINRFLTNIAGQRFERICKSYIGFLTPLPPVHRETEWAFDYRDAKRLLTEYRNLLLQEGHTYNFVQEVRFTKSDNFWLSPAYHRDTIWLSMYNMDTHVNWERQLKLFETWAMNNGGRPHWGKEANLDFEYLHGQYGQLVAFRETIQKYDPQKKLANKWNGRFYDI